jgi:protease-4
LREKEREFMQASVERIYTTFITKVAEGRKMNKEEVDSIGQGRVWTGEEAVKINLVDELGGLKDAISYAAKKANVKEYRVIELPQPKNPFESFLGKTGDDAESRLMQKHLGIAYAYVKQLQTILSSKGVLARLPYELVAE